MKPIIGINCDYEEEGKQPYSFTYRDYSEAVVAAGGIPFLLPIIKDKSDVELLLKKIAGLLLPGGNDVPPQRYGEERQEKTVCVHPDKDTSDFILVGTSIQMKKPILAICYGIQLVNVALGGSLIQDIPSEVKTPIIHKDSQNKRYTHTVTIRKDSLLHKIIGTDRIEANSTHHQAIKRLGKGLKDTAHTADGIIEAIECRDYPFLVGVQWHPERMTGSPYHLALFNALIKASE
ncbi:MAG TPA: gamma-glutamyl-gamma-aminobutyrate hydrolase family protein [Candidatus Wunengus sp. YC60]|uniref:gamma-glutamyl-gamma-aminobutyrate hydrolase family protein n=1 Tax=Candidatus Wunengus sp. YC60 TaxID=3367697 RepID=UPI004027767D